jgi:DNA-binding transcriptional ArsR family regulator
VHQQIYAARTRYRLDPFALSDPTRRAAIRLLWGGEERCVCEPMKQIDASQSRRSRHMARSRKVADDAAIAGYGVASTPGLVIDGKVVDAGGLPRPEDVAK